MFYNLFSIILGLSSVSLLVLANEDTSNTLNILMPDVVANHVDDYVCSSFELDTNKPTYITAFNPSATSKDAHHMLLYGCTEPGSQKKIWNCGEMANTETSSSQKYETGPMCASGSTIIYAWAMDANKTELPKDVAFKIGASTPIKYLVLQVHFANIDKFKAGETDRSGFVLTTSPTPSSKRAGVYSLSAGGYMQANAEELFEVACKIQQDIVMHPFAFRAHTHKLGLVNSGYRVRGTNDDQQWTEIGRRSPQLPQMFSPIKDNITIQQDDYVAAICTMFNTRSHVVRVGPTGNDEMCNFYMMYWVDGEQLLDDTVCISQGPPNYYFRRDRALNVDKIPGNAFSIPPPPNGPAPGESLQNGTHHMMMMQHKENPLPKQFRYRYINDDNKRHR